MNEKEETDERIFISIRDACKYTGMCSQTLRKFADLDKIKTYKTLSGQRKFDKRSLQEMCNTVSFMSKKKDDSKQNFIYARVSSKKQMDDLSRQIDFIKSNRPEYASFTIISDVGSGINFKRQGLLSILDTCLQRDIGRVVIAHRDRLSRFAYDFINTIIKKSGGEIIVIDDEQNKSSEQELAEDLLSIIHIYSCRQMGRRKYKNKTKNNNDSTKNE